MDTVQGGNAALELSWIRVDGADGYGIYFAPSNDSRFKLYRTVDGSTTRMRISGSDQGSALQGVCQGFEG